MSTPLLSMSTYLVPHTLSWTNNLHLGSSGFLLWSTYSNTGKRESLSLTVAAATSLRPRGCHARLHGSHKAAPITGLAPLNANIKQYFAIFGELDCPAYGIDVSVNEDAIPLHMIAQQLGELWLLLKTQIPARLRRSRSTPFRSRWFTVCSMTLNQPEPPPSTPSSTPATTPSSLLTSAIGFFVPDGNPDQGNVQQQQSGTATMGDSMDVADVMKLLKAVKDSSSKSQLSVPRIGGKKSTGVWTGKGAGGLGKEP